MQYKTNGWRVRMEGEGGGDTLRLLQKFITPVTFLCKKLIVFVIYIGLLRIDRSVFKGDVIIYKNRL